MTAISTYDFNYEYFSHHIVLSNRTIKRKHVYIIITKNNRSPYKCKRYVCHFTRREFSAQIVHQDMTMKKDL